jgi:hypothetical protein
MGEKLNVELGERFSVGVGELLRHAIMDGHSPNQVIQALSYGCVAALGTAATNPERKIALEALARVTRYWVEHGKAAEDQRRQSELKREQARPT